MAGFFSKRQYAAMAESELEMKLLKERCLECSIYAMVLQLELFRFSLKKLLSSEGIFVYLLMPLRAFKAYLMT